MKISSVDVTSDLYNAGLNDDGTEYHAEVYLVLVEFSNGERWAHNTTFRSAKKEYDEDGYPHYADLRAEAREQACFLRDRILKAIGEGKILHKEHWHKYYPVYGSVAFLEEEEGETEMD
jgi:hypothetical protein